MGQIKTSIPGRAQNFVSTQTTAVDTNDSIWASMKITLRQQLLSLDGSLTEQEINSILSSLRIFVIQTIEFARESRQNEFKASLIREVVAGSKGSITSLVTSAIGGNANADASAVLAQVMAQLEVQVQGFVQGLSGADRNAYYIYAMSDAYISDIVASVMAQLRAIVQQEIQAQLTVLKTQTVKVVASSDRVSSLFGTGGANFIKHKTPAFDYGVEFGKRR